MTEPLTPAAQALPPRTPRDILLANCGTLYRDWAERQIDLIEAEARAEADKRIAWFEQKFIAQATAINEMKDARATAEADVVGLRSALADFLTAADIQGWPRSGIPRLREVSNRAARLLAAPPTEPPNKGLPPFGHGTTPNRGGGSEFGR